MAERKKRELQPMIIEVGCKTHDPQRVVEGLLWILNRGRAEPPPPSQSVEDIESKDATNRQEKSEQA